MKTIYNYVNEKLELCHPVNETLELCHSVNEKLSLNNSFIINERLSLNKQSVISKANQVKISKATFKQIGEYVNELHAYIIPHLNDKWQSYLKETFNDNNIDNIYKNKKAITLKEYRGYEGRFSWQEGLYREDYSCMKNNIQKTINILNETINDDNYKNEEYSLIFSTCCDYLGCNVIGDDPGTEWTVGIFRKVNTAMYMAIYRLINI